ncbi:hypothetical protein CR513_27469, partial [Mucuna pruriens]
MAFLRPNLRPSYMRRKLYIWKRRVNNVLNFPTREKRGRKNRFPTLRKSKLFLRGDGPFKVLQLINDNSCVLDMPQDYGGSTSFNIFDLSYFISSMEDPNLTTNSFQQGDGGGSSMNVDSLRLVEMLSLPTLVHPRPYKIQMVE